MLGEGFDAKTLPGECQLSARYVEATQGRIYQFVPALFDRLELCGRESVKKAEHLISLIGLGVAITQNVVQESDAGQLECMVARARQSVQRGITVSTGALEVVEGFGAPAMSALLQYARSHGGEQAAMRCAADLGMLGECLDSPRLAGGVRKMVTDLGVVASYHNLWSEEGDSARRINGLGRVINGCLTLLKEHANRSTEDGAVNTDDRALIPAVNGFAAEAAVARRLLERNHIVLSLDEVISYQSRSRTKEVDIIAQQNIANAAKVKWAIEVKASWGALEHSLQNYSDRQLIGLCRAAVELGATPAVIVDERSVPAPHLAAALRRIVTRCKDLTGKTLLVLNGDFGEALR